MKKNIVQDVIPPRRSIRNVELPSRTRNIQNKIPKIIEKELPESLSNEDYTPKSPVRNIERKVEISRNDKIPPPSENPSYTYEYDEPRKSRKKGLYIASGIFLVALAFGISSMFKSAEIKITPKQEVKALNETFTAKKDVAANGLSFQIVTITKDVEKIAEATSEERVDRKSQGKIIIYNNYSSAPQKLVATTRFQTAEGLIFRLINAATVPGKQTKDGKAVAGSIEVSVEADKPGVEYNIGLKDFTIPGFKGDPKYDQIYARSKTEMSGGFSGMQKTVSKDVLAKTDAELEEQLKTSLGKDIESQIPANFVLYKASLSYNFDKVNQVNNSSGALVIKKKGEANGIIFDKGALSRAILAKVSPNETSDVLKITNLPDLNFSLSSSSSFDPNTSTGVTFNLKGSANIVWVFDENKLKSDLLGLTKKNATAIIATYKTIKEAWVMTYPFWNNKIPKDPAKVTLVNTLTK